MNEQSTFQLCLLDQGYWPDGIYTAPAADAAASYERFVARVKALAQTGLPAAIYTQTTDVEQEITGLITYDREVEKIPVGTIAWLNKHAFPEI